MTSPQPNSAFPIQDSPAGLLLVDKDKGRSSFSLVHLLRKRLGVKKIGHAGTLDPFATGVMVMLIGRSYTKLSDQFLLSDKEYVAEVHLGSTTDTYDSEGMITSSSSIIPTLDEIKKALAQFQGTIQQIPPMYSAKKVKGKKLYELARQGIEIERKAVTVQVDIHLIDYNYPILEMRVVCSKGTYIRSLAYDIGQTLGCGAHLKNLRRTRSGSFKIENCITEAQIKDDSFPLLNYFQLEFS